MRKIKNHNLAQLLMQLRFTPPKKRGKQLEAAAKLFSIIKKDKEYPFEFVCFRITGFHPRNLPPLPLIKGEDLAEDMAIFITKLSGQIAAPASLQEQKVYSTESLAEELAVSTKTINRWRKRGLVARKFVFEDGKRRFGFLQSSVDKFLRENEHLATKAQTFNRLSEKEKDLIIKRTRELAAKTKLSRHQIIEKIASERNRAHETIRYTILNYERLNPAKPVFGKPAGVIGPAEASELYKLFKQDSSVKELMARFDRSKSSIYRLINKRRGRELLTKKIDFVASDEFLEKDAAEKIFADSGVSPESILTRDAEAFRQGPSSLPDYLKTLKDTHVLSRDREVSFFRRYNFLKYLASKKRVGLKVSGVSSAVLKQIEGYLSEAEGIKNAIIEANLQLVVSIAGKHTGGNTNMLDLVSEGNLSLMRAVEKFDYTRGFRFATYATWAIAKDFARRIPAESARFDKAGAASVTSVGRDMRASEATDFAAIDSAHKSLVQVIRENLDEREQYIILNHFGLIGTLIRKDKKTLKEIGEHLDITKERVRQIELSALQKLRQSLSIEEFDLLTS